jgi:hypothetical protein
MVSHGVAARAVEIGKLGTTKLAGERYLNAEAELSIGVSSRRSVLDYVSRELECVVFAKAAANCIAGSEG